MKVFKHLDTNENFWSIACILGILGIPGMVVGGAIARTYGISSAIFSICIGNLILWILGLGIISMTQGKGHAIDNIKKHFGVWSGYLAALIFALDFLMWFTVQVSITSNVLSRFFKLDEDWKIGITLSCIVTLLSIGGFKFLKWFCLLSFPIILTFLISSIELKSETLIPPQSFSLSYFGIFLVMMNYLSGMVNLPTFFRHSKSKADSIIALSLIMLAHIAFQILMIFSKIDTVLIQVANGSYEPSSHVFLLSLTLFCLLSFFCINLVNIYFVSACWEMLFPKDYRSRKYIIFGIVGTISYVYLKSIENSKALLVAQNIMSYSMVILLISLLANFLIALAVKHRLRYLDKFLGGMSWVIGSTVTVIRLIQNPNNPNEALLLGVSLSLLFSILTVFIEETIWSLHKIKKRS